MPLPNSGLSPAGQQLGLGTAAPGLGGNGRGETDEQRRQRLLQEAQKRLGMSPAGGNLFLGYTP
jgi:hypothetical protein